jgi:hypothetical protein
VIPSRKVNIAYPELLAAVGRFIVKQGLSDVCVMEYEDGVIVVGSVLYETGEIMNRRTVTHVLAGDELRRLVKGG